MPDIVLESGRTLSVKIASFSAANKFRKVLANEMLKVEIDLGKLNIPKGGSLLDLDVSALPPEAINTVKNIFMTLLASDAVEACVWECAARCTIDGQRITKGTATEPGTFEPEEARGDFLPCAMEVMKTNVPPFFASLGLSSLINALRAKSAPP